MALPEKEIEMKKNEQQDKANQFQVKVNQPQTLMQAMQQQQAPQQQQSQNVHDNSSTKTGHNAFVRKSNVQALNMFLFLSFFKY